MIRHAAPRPGSVRSGRVGRVRQVIVPTGPWPSGSVSRGRPMANGNRAGRLRLVHTALE